MATGDLHRAMLPLLLFVVVLCASIQVQATVLKRSTGALTPLSSKSKACSVLDYGGVADGKTDVGPAISKAFSDCVGDGSATLVVPEGNYSLATGVNLNGASAWAFQLDGLITLTSDGDFGGNAIVIQKTSDLEFFSSNGKGAINGQGYITRRDSTSQNARLLRFMTVSDLAVHDLILVDSPTFHLVFNSVSNLDMYHITVRGPDIGGTDGIDLICEDNCYLHDFEVTNRDECVSVKTPSQNVLIEDAYCNHSGGMSIGSLTADDVTEDSMAALSNITMNNIYSYKSTQMLMIKTFPGGDGTTGYVKDSKFTNFWSYDCTYGLDIDQFWESHDTPNTGAVALSGLTFSNWTGHVDNGVSRGPIVIRGSDQVPLTDITLEDFNMWTLNGDKIINQCKNAFGTGYCLEELASGAQATAYTVSTTVTATPSAYVSPAKPSWGVEGYGTTVPIPVYTPAVMWPVSSTSVTVRAQYTTPAASEYTLGSAPASISTVPVATASYPTDTPALTSYPSVSIFPTISLSNGLPVESTPSASPSSAGASSETIPAASAPTFSSSKTPCSSELASATPSATPVATESAIASAASVVAAPSTYSAVPIPSAQSPSSSRKPCSSSLVGVSSVAPASLSIPVTMPLATDSIIYTSYPSVSIFPTLTLSNGLPVESTPSAPIDSVSSSSKKPCSDSASTAAPAVTTAVASASSAPASPPIVSSKKPCSESSVIGAPSPVTTPVASVSTKAVGTPVASSYPLVPPPVAASSAEVGLKTVVVTVTKTACPVAKATL